MRKQSFDCFGLYIHIPFCVQKCRYCDFLSFRATPEEKAHYISLLCEELEKQGQLLFHKQVSTLYLGGGTPSCLPSEQIKQVMEMVHRFFTIQEGAEMTIEVNPGTVDEDKLRTYRKLGFQRLSIGLQATQDELLRTLGRIHTLAEFEQTYALARRVGFENINVDLMTGLPGQTSQMLRDSLERIHQWNPEHVSCYSLIVEEGTPFFQERDKLDLPDEELDREMYELTKTLLREYGYEQYEISNYGKPGKAAKHNCSYWKRVPYLGVGLGASSLMEECRFSNPRSMKEYEAAIRKGDSDNLMRFADVTSITPLSQKEQMEEFMFLGLRMREGICKTTFEQTFGQSIDQVYGDVLRRLLQDKLLQEKGDWISLTEYGVDVSNYVFVQLLL